ncbi:hypothetical protein ACPB8Q_07160 [Methanocaldococcus indicus]|uniref:hypothetical protein n=1 Tax=Methanocaldococcus indicus TaxID=213231 RepID=UPI003C6D8B13
MINSIDIFLGTIILLIGFTYWSINLSEYNNNYVYSVKEDYKLSKAIETLKTLADDGTLENAVLLYYFGEVNTSKHLLEEKINLDRYMVKIDGHMLINKSYVNNGDRYVVAVLVLNRSEGWYVIYGNYSTIKISKNRYLDFDEALNEYSNYTIHMPVYLSKNISVSRVVLYY